MLQSHGEDEPERDDGDIEVDRSRSSEDDDDATLAQVVAEIGDRFERGESIDQQAYLERHPELAERLRSLWPVLLATALNDPISTRSGQLCMNS